MDMNSETDCEINKQTETEILASMLGYYLKYAPSLGFYPIHKLLVKARGQVSQPTLFLATYIFL
jgi:hypothetical protein